MTVTPTASVATLYNLAEAYDIAFDFRDLGAECDALDEICQSFGAGAPKSFLDLACGPGYHCIEYGRRGRRSLGLDNNPAMLRYATAKAGRAGADVTFLRADMRDFALHTPVDWAFCAMSSFHHLLTNEDILAHLRSVGRSLAPGGIYVIEADHPRDVFGVGQSLKHEWESIRGQTVVRMRWGAPDDHFDPITQIKQITVSVGIDQGEVANPAIIDFITPYRQLSHQELRLLVDASGVFEAVAWLGTLDAKMPMTNDKVSNRMVAVLRTLPVA